MTLWVFLLPPTIQRHDSDYKLLIGVNMNG